VQTLLVFSFVLFSYIQVQFYLENQFLTRDVIYVAHIEMKVPLSLTRDVLLVQTTSFSATIAFINFHEMLKSIVFEDKL